MSETTAACVRGCGLYGQHLTTCDGHTLTGHDCRGCLPRRAQHGHLCWPCHRRFELMLTDAPTVYRWLTGNLRAGEGTARPKQDHEQRGGSRDVPAPIKLDVLDLRDLLRDQLAAWVDDFASGQDLKAPRVGIDGDAEFLLKWLQSIEFCDWVGDWWEELAETMTQAHALAPWRPEMKRIHAVPCPECAETNLAIFGGETDVTCLSCSTLIPEQRYGIWERMLVDERSAG